jgi:hypothetical protein
MLRESTLSVSCEVQNAVKQLLAEDARFDEQERRSLHRETLVRPITMLLGESGEVVGGICRNISSMGACLLTRRPPEEKSVAKICIHCLDGAPKVFLAECRWNRLFGTGWYMSGWNFIHLVKQH